MDVFARVHCVEGVHKLRVKDIETGLVAGIAKGIARASRELEHGLHSARKELLVLLDRRGGGGRRLGSKDDVDLGNGIKRRARRSRDELFGEETLKVLANQDLDGVLPSSYETRSAATATV